MAFMRQSQNKHQNNQNIHNETINSTKTAYQRLDSNDINQLINKAISDRNVAPNQAYPVIILNNQVSAEDVMTNNTTSPKYHTQR